MIAFIVARRARDQAENAGHLFGAIKRRHEVHWFGAM